jgi:hypothetical protein
VNEFEQVEVKRKNCANTVVIGIILAVLGFILAFMVEDIQFIGFILIVIALIVIAVGYGKFNALSKEFKNKYLRELINKTFDNAEYYPDRGIDKDRVYATNLVKRADRYHTEDLIKGDVEGVKFETCDLKLEERHVRHTKNGTQVYYVTYFLGRFFEFEFPKEFKSKIIVTESGLMTFFSSFKKLEMESVEFNKKFKTYAQNEHDAFYVLTPHLMEAILELEQSNPGTIALLFTGNKLNITINNNRNTFEMSLFRKVDMSIINQLQRDLNVIKDIVLELKLNRNIFTH